MSDPGFSRRQETRASQLQSQIQLCMTQRQNLEAIFDSITDGVVAMDVNLGISNINAAAQGITGYSRQEAIGKPCLEIIKFAAEEEQLNRIFQERRVVDGFKVGMVDRVGGRHQLLVSTRLLKDGDGIERGLVLVLRDITELEGMRRQLEGRSRFHGLIGKNHQMHEIYQLVEDLSDSDATVLVLGESGTGKELVAGAIHQNSYRSEGPFVKVNCSALSEGLLESELFGHVKGAFTGAIRDKIGRFEQASGGTIFLDEIGDLSPNVQVKLLRVMQERQIERVGSNQTIAVDARVIAATHRDLRHEIKQARFREDLFYRLNVMPIQLPPLRERLEDLPLLATHFVERFNACTSRNIEGVGAEALSLMMDYDWPGNVRELENAIEHAFIKCRGEVILPQCLPQFLREQAVEPKSAPKKIGSDKERALHILRQCQWNRSVAAQRLGMHRTTLWRKMKEWGIETAVETKY